jgi:uncharacterized membrane protein
MTTDRWSNLISTESLAEEIARTLVTSIGLILAVPMTTGIAAVLTAAAHPAGPVTRSG